jgi:two-component system OmpR family response regulator
MRAGHAMMERMRVLLVEDDPALASVVARGLDEEGLTTTIARTGEEALAEATHSSWDAIVLDIGLPGIDGYEVCRRLRAERMRAPVLMLTARDAVSDRIAGLEGGADDYLVKPFSFGELLARLRALDRRARGRPEDDVLAVEDLRLDPQARRAWRGRRELLLSPREFALLEAFLRRPGHLLTRQHLLEHVWDARYEARSNLVDVYVRYLRQKVDRPFGTDSIETVWGEGYRLRVPDDPA